MYARFIVENRDNIWYNQKRTHLAHFRKKSYLEFFLKFSAKRVLCALGHIFNKKFLIQKPDTVGAQNWPGR